MFDGTAAPAIEDSTVVIEGERVLACGPRAAAADVGSERTKRMIQRLAERGSYVNPTLITLDRTVERGRRGIEELDADPAMEEYAASARSGWRATRGRFVEGWSAADYDQAGRALERVKHFTGAMFEADVPIHVATDAPFACILSGSSFHREHRLLVESGLEPGRCPPRRHEPRGGDARGNRLRKIGRRETGGPRDRGG